MLQVMGSVASIIFSLIPQHFCTFAQQTGQQCGGEGPIEECASSPQYKQLKSLISSVSSCLFDSVAKLITGPKISVNFSFRLSEYSLLKSIRTSCGVCV